jgi:hypothetical protein
LELPSFDDFALRDAAGSSWIYSFVYKYTGCGEPRARRQGEGHWQIIDPVPPI